MSGPTSTKTPSEMEPAAAGGILSEAPHASSRRIERLLARSALYRASAFFFRHPGLSKNVPDVRENAVIWRKAARTLPFAGKSGLQKSVDRLLAQFQKARVEKWAEDYERCFGHTANSAVPAYELEYGEEHSHRQPQQLADITAFYAAFGLELSERARERADHISVECEFVHYLLYKEALALESGLTEKAEVCRDASGRFLAEHLGFWLPSFAKRLSKHSNGLMKLVADFAYEFVVLDCRVLGVAAGSESLPIRLMRTSGDNGCVSCVSGPDRGLSGGKQ